MTLTPALFVTVRVYVVSAAGLTVAAVPELTVPTLLFTLPLPLLNTAVRVVEVPVVMGDLAAVKLEMTGTGGG